MFPVDVVLDLDIRHDSTTRMYRSAEGSFENNAGIYNGG